MDDVDVPLYYIVGRSVADLDGVVQLLSLTPCLTAIATKNGDVAIAHQLAPTVIGDCDPLKVIEHTKRPCVVISDGDKVEAVYPDRRERVA